MTLNEFKAWLEGYSAGFYMGYPSEQQWKAVLDKLERVEPQLMNLNVPFSPRHPDSYPAAYAPYFKNTCEG